MQRANRRGLAVFTVWAILVQALGAAVLLAPASPAAAQQAGAAISVTKGSPAELLAGNTARYEITVNNTGNQLVYNASISDLLPLNATFIGNVSPASAGQPTTSTDPVTGRTLLLWLNLTDIPPGGSYSLSFDVDLGPAANTVGNVITNNTGAASSTDERDIPDFDASGNPVGSGTTQTASDSLTTRITALRIEKSASNAPEGELLRGVHDNRSVYTLTITNNDVAATQNIVVSDFIAAGMEFLACGDVDNSVAITQEYPGSGPLGTPPLNPDPCPTPVTVDTQDNRPAGSSTTVTWNVGTLAPGEVREIKYVAGIPLRANTTSWPGGAVPTPASGQQGANLDNNNGTSTQETANEGSLPNLAVAAGTYTGPISPGTSPEVSASDTASVRVEDLRLRKSVSPNDPTVGQIVRYSLTIDTSEYVSARGIVVTDELPDGLCPVGPGLPSGDPICVGGAAPSVPFASVTPNQTTGGYTLVFGPLDVPTANGTITITYDALFRDTYNDFGPNAGSPTVAGDTFTNTARLTGQTVPAVDSGESVQDVVLDESSTSFGTPGTATSKQMKPRYIGTTCDPDQGQPYADADALTTVQRSFRKGDLICFKLRVQFPANVNTRNPVVTDFVPPGTSYVAGSFTPTAANTVAINGPDISPSTLVMRLGAPDKPGSSDLFVAPGGIFEATLAVRVDAPSSSSAPDIAANLLKLRHESTDGTIFSDRAQAGFEILPPPDVAVRKGVYTVDAPPSGPNGPDVDGVQVQQNAAATFRVDITNSPFAGFEGLDYSIRGVQAWDVLPVGISCAGISDFQYQAAGPIPNPTPTLTPLPAGIATCYDPGTGPAINPAYGDRAAQGLIVWAFPSPDVASQYAIPAGASMTLTYRMTIPPVVSVSTRYDNTVALPSYQAFTNELNITTTYYPQNNIDPTVPLQDAPPAADPSWVFTADAAATKSQTTAITEQNNNEATQAVIGEEVTYTVSAIIPAQTTVYNAVLRDPLPRSGSTQYVELLGATQSGPVPLTLDADTATDTATLTFPPIYTNTTDAPQTFVMTITGRVTTVAQNRHSQSRTNTATFTSNAALDGSPLPPRQAQTTLRVVEPSPSVTKVATPTTVIGGQTVQYTVTVRNGNGRPPLHDAWTVDCLPALLSYTGVVSVSAGTVSTQTGDGANGCAAGTTRIEWLIGTVSAGQPRTLVYTALVDPQVIAGTSLTNPVTARGSSLDNGSITPVPIEREYTANSSATIEVSGAELVKSVSPGTATIGDVVTYTVSEAIPENTNFYETTLIDTLPAGLDPNVDLVSVTCLGNGCDLIEANPGYGTLLTGSGQQIGVYVGDVPTAPTQRTIVTTYRTTVLNLPVDAVGAPNQAGATPDNSATIWWSTDPNAPRPVSVLDPPNLPSATSRGPATAEFLIIEPQVAIAKSVSTATPQPGEQFTYTVDVANPTGPTVSTAYGVVVSDTIPAGIVVDPASISDGGVLTGADPITGGGTITWTLGDLGPGEGTALTYSAVLAPSPTLTAAPLANTAAVDEYFSLPAGNDERRRYSGPSASATVTPQFPRIVTEKSVAAGSEALIDEPFAWRITVSNTGGADAFNVDVNDTLPVNWCYVANSAEVTLPDGGVQNVEPAITGACAGDAIQQSLTWDNLFDLPAGASATITLQTVATSLVIDTPGVGLSVPQTNVAVATGEDVTGATANREGSYSAGPDDAVAGIRSADLSITKTADPVIVTAGGTATFRITVTNNGPDPSLAPILVTDRVPAPLLVSSAGGPGWTCITAGPFVDCGYDGAPLAPGASLPELVITAAVPSSVANGEVLVNTADVFGATLDPNFSNNSDTALVAVQRVADLQIVKTTTSQPVVPGRDVTYDLAVSNLGPSTANGPIVVSDTLPSPLVPVAAGGTGWTCQINGQDVTCTQPDDVPAAAPGNALPIITVTAQLPPDFTGNLVNTASVTGQSPDPNPGNNTSTVTDPAVPSADLFIAKTTQTDPVVAGETIAYTLGVGNLGPSTAAVPTTVTDTLPAGLTFVSATGSGWTCSAAGQTITCSYGLPLPPNVNAAPITVVAAVDPDLTGDVTNPASVTGPTPDPNPGNNTDTVTDPTTARADLAVAKTTVTDPIVPGRDVTYEVVVSNLGPSTSRAPITVTDTLPDGLTFISASGTGWTCTSAISCTSGTDLPAGTDAAPITITAALDSDFAGDLTNTVRVTGTTPDPNPGNNTATVTDPTQPSADLAITKTTATSPVVPGAEVTYQLSVTNNGPSTSRATITVTDPLPAGVAFVSATGTGWTCDGTVTCTRNTDLAAGQSAPAITVVGQVEAGFTGDLTNTATVTGTTPDPDPGNNTATVVDPTAPSADLAIEKQTATNPVVPGEDVTYTVTVTNLGPSVSRQPITVTDTLDPALTFVSADGPGWTCDDTITCVRDTDLAAGATTDPITIVATLDPAFTGDLANTATATGTTPDPDPGNNTATVIDPTQPSADLAISKTTTTQDLTQGGPVAYEVVVANNGPSTSAGPITVSDTLPDALTYTDAGGDGWVCSAAGQVVTCTREAALAAGQSAPPIRITATLATAFFGDLTNSATVTGSTPDPDPGNNTATVTDPVAPLVDLAVTKVAGGDFVVGTRGTFILTVVNNGPTADPGPVTVVDQLPVGLAYVSANGEGWTCAAAGPQITCTFPAEFAVGSPSTITVVVDVLAAAAPQVTNAAEVGSPAKDTEPANNRDEVTVPVTVPADRTPGTGADVAQPLLLGVLALIIGGLAVVVGSRRRRTG